MKEDEELNDLDSDLQLRHMEIAENFIKNFLTLSNKNKIIDFWQNERKQLQYIESILFSGEDKQDNKENKVIVFKDVDLFCVQDIISKRLEKVEELCRELAINEGSPPTFGIEETKKIILEETLKKNTGENTLIS